MSSRMGYSAENKPFSVSHQEITVQFQISGMRLGAYVVNENLMSACLLLPMQVLHFLCTLSAIMCS